VIDTAKVVEELTPAEMQRRMDEWLASMQKDQRAAKAMPQAAVKAKAKAASPKANKAKK